MRRRHLAAPTFIALLLVVAIVAPTWEVRAAVGDQLLPNLKALPARDIRFASGPALRFSTISWNAGTGPLHLQAGTTYGDNTQDVWQWIALEGGGWDKRLAGRFVWHPAHAHFHFEGYAVYTLQPAGSPGVAARTSQKTTFCVMDSTKVDGTLPGAPSTAGYTTCGNSIQGMSVGWGDLYSYSLAGQSFDLTGLADGDYRLVVDVDPQNKLSESDRTDNSSCVLVRIKVSAASVQVLNPTGCESITAVTVDSISPASTSVGTSVNVTIKGNNLTSGMAVSFINGSGATPTASNVTFVDATTITATVTVPRLKAGKDPLWDLRVGSTILRNAFRVLSPII